MAKDQPVTYRDIAKLPSQSREQWRLACQEELEALHKCKVYELANSPLGYKAVKNCWVFMTKSDGHKKARLIAFGSSQIEGIDFNQIFSLVVQYESVCYGTDLYNAFTIIFCFYFSLSYLLILSKRALI